VDEAVRRHVVQGLTRLIRLRATHPAFQGRFALLDAPDGEMAMEWRADSAPAELRADLGNTSYRLDLTPVM
jgi:sucrose phosphorylase